MNPNNLSRMSQAVESREYALQQARLDVDSLFASLRILTKVLEPKEPRPAWFDWAFLAYTLIGYDSASTLARLESEGVIPRAAIPKHWIIFAGEGLSLPTAIRAARTTLARHILICILPKVAK